MPRPTHSKSSGTTTKFTNPFSNWRARREAKQMQAQEAIAKTITDDTANNEQMITSNLRQAIRLNKQFANLAKTDLEFAGFNINSAL